MKKKKNFFAILPSSCKKQERYKGKRQSEMDKYRKNNSDAEKRRSKKRESKKNSKQKEKVLKMEECQKKKKPAKNLVNSLHMLLNTLQLPEVVSLLYKQIQR